MAIISALVASCAPITDPQSLGLTSPSLAGAEAGAAAAPDMTASDMTQDEVSTDGYAMSDQPEALPDTIDYTPVEKPTPPAQEATAPAADAATAAGDPTVSTAQAAQAAASDAQAQSAAAAPVEQPASATNDQTAAAGVVPVPDDYPVVVTATDPDQAFAPPQKKKSFFASLFSTNEANAKPVIASQPEPKPIIADEEQAKPLIAETSAGDSKPVKTASLASSEGMIDEGALPGVRQSALFEIKRKSGLDDDSDVDVHEDEDWGPVNVATAGGLARLAPNGLVRQTDQVDVACLKPSLVRVLKTVEGHYGRKLVVTSGYRSPERNRRARGAKNSLHMYCAAADIQVPGVTKWELASYFRTMPGRGGVGTYCHTESVHIDVGPERDWNWRCRRRK
jgi:uncharacterized protein YcbK (DUF882 family)